ncbi:MAG: diaminopimelate epimerase [Vicingaceae bacterium]
MKLRFFKYQGTGNDFIMLDGTEIKHQFSAQEILKICHRRFGIGADGLIILKPHDELDFEMDYYNADGSQSFCGNGSRCAQAFAKQLAWINQKSKFLAIDGIHEGKFQDGWFATKMAEVAQVKQIGADYFIHTGSPHYIRFVPDASKVEVLNEGRAIRNQEEYRKEGTNVNFVSLDKEKLTVRTYERGVEDETYSCGTGVTAAAIAYIEKSGNTQQQVEISTLGGALRIELEKMAPQHYTNIWLCGPAEFVYEGEYSI